MMFTDPEQQATWEELLATLNGKPYISGLELETFLSEISPLLKDIPPQTSHPHLAYITLVLYSTLKKEISSSITPARIFEAFIEPCFKTSHGTVQKLSNDMVKTFKEELLDGSIQKLRGSSTKECAEKYIPILKELLFQNSPLRAVNPSEHPQTSQQAGLSSSSMRHPPSAPTPASNPFFPLTGFLFSTSYVLFFATPISFPPQHSFPAHPPRSAQASNTSPPPSQLSDPHAQAPKRYKKDQNEGRGSPT